MNRQFFSISLQGQTKYVVKEDKRFMFHAITMVTAKESGEDTQIQIFGENGGKQFLQGTINTKQPTAQLKIILSQDNINTLYAVGTGTVDLLGFSVMNEFASQSPQLHHHEYESLGKQVKVEHKLPPNLNSDGDHFNALKAKPERADDDIDLSRMSKKQLKRFKQNRAREAQGN